jgi:predicted GNAT family acetyltransferase
MEVRTFRDPVAFRGFADPLLLSDEARNNLILAVTGTLIDQPDVYPEFHLWAVEEHGDPLAVAALTPPRPLLLGDAAADRALEVLAAGVADSGVSVTRLLGNQPGVGRFVTAWAEVANQPAEVDLSHGVFALSQVRSVPEVTGTPRRATEHDVDTLVDWIRAFLFEVDPDMPGPTDSGVRRRIDSDPSQSGYWIWEVDGAPVSFSGHGGRTPNGIRIGPVYTPEEHRRRGYATSLVAAQSRWLLDIGYRFCFLYTDLGDPTANAVYRTIGYEQVAEATRYVFNPG